MKAKKDIEKTMLEEIEKSDMSIYELSKLSGVSQASLSLFVNGKRGLSLRSGAKLAEALGLELVKKKAR